MKLTKSRLKKIIKEELLRESDDGGRQGAVEGVIESGITYLHPTYSDWLSKQSHEHQAFFQREFTSNVELKSFHGTVDLGDIDQPGLEEYAQLAYNATVYKIAGAPGATGIATL
jgi:hypothetical protein